MTRPKKDTRSLKKEKPHDHGGQPCVTPPDRDPEGPHGSIGNTDDSRRGRRDSPHGR